MPTTELSMLAGGTVGVNAVATWPEAHDVSDGTGKTVGNPAMQGQYVGGKYYCSRGFVAFDTSSLNGKYIVSTKLRMQLSTSPTTNPKEAQAGYTTTHIVEGIQTIPVAYADYGSHLTKTVSGGSLSAAGLIKGDWYDIDLNAFAISLIDKTGITKFCLRLAGEIDNITPTGGNAIWWDFPKLVVEYEDNPPPIAEASYAGSIGQSYATLYGKIVDDSGAACECRFRYRKGSDAYSYTSWANGKGTGDTFSEAISGLIGATQYEFAAQAKNPLEGDWSASKYFMTLSPRSTVAITDKITLEAIRNLEMSARGRFNVNKEGNAVYKSRYARNA